MATLAKANSGAFPMQQIGRELEWVEYTGDLTDKDDLETAYNALSTICTVTIIGASDGSTTMFGCEGVGAPLPANFAAVTLTGSAFV